MRTIFKKVYFFVMHTKIKFNFLINRFLYGRLIVLISSPYYGNVGDHAILLAEKEVIKKAGHAKRIIDISSREYVRHKTFIKTCIKNEDIIVIDGGGNFGDVWPVTQGLINTTINMFHENPILVFPESWYFTDEEIGQKLLAETIDTISNHKNIVIYARDSWSYQQMKVHLKKTEVRMSYDTVFMLPIDICKKKAKGVAIVIREDKESVNNILDVSLLESKFKENGISFFRIYNDCYKHIRKNQRKHYVNKVIAQYLKSELVITDRFHGLVISLLCKKPCIVIDNKTGKVGNFYNDIRDKVSGVLFLKDSDDIFQKIIDFKKKNIQSTMLSSFNQIINDGEDSLIKTINHFLRGK